MLGEQDPQSAHGFNIYYTGLSPAAFKRQPPFLGTNPDVYSTNYHNFSCDDATGMETQAKFADTVYSRDTHGLFVNLFVPSEVSWAATGVTIRQSTGFPDEPATHLKVVSGSARMAIRIRLPGWLAGPARAWVNGEPLPGPHTPGTWLVIERQWRPGDRVDVSLPMTLALNRTPDEPAVQAVTYGPVVLSGGYGGVESMFMPGLNPGSVTRAPGRRLRFQATANGRPVTLIPIARMQHQHYNVYWLT
jgi:DUF1680 family protein